MRYILELLISYYVCYFTINHNKRLEKTSDVIVFFDLFGEFDHFEDSDAAEQRGKRIWWRYEEETLEELKLLDFGHVWILSLLTS